MWFVSDSDRPTVATSGVPLLACHERDRAVRRGSLPRELERAHHRLGVVGEVERAERRRALERDERVVQRLRERREPLVVPAQHRHGDLGLPREQAAQREHEEDERERRQSDAATASHVVTEPPPRVRAPLPRPSIEGTLEGGADSLRRGGSVRPPGYRRRGGATLRIARDARDAAARAPAPRGRRAHGLPRTRLSSRQRRSRSLRSSSSGRRDPRGRRSRRSRS